MAVYSDTK